MTEDSKLFWCSYSTFHLKLFSIAIWYNLNTLLWRFSFWVYIQTCFHKRLTLSKISREYDTQTPWQMKGLIWSVLKCVCLCFSGSFIAPQLHKNLVYFLLNTWNVTNETSMNNNIKWCKMKNDSLLLIIVQKLPPDIDFPKDAVANYSLDTPCLFYMLYW